MIFYFCGTIVGRELRHSKSIETRKTNDISVKCFFRIQSRSAAASSTWLSKKIFQTQQCFHLCTNISNWMFWCVLFLFQSWEAIGFSFEMSLVSRTDSECNDCYSFSREDDCWAIFWQSMSLFRFLSLIDLVVVHISTTNAESWFHYLIDLGFLFVSTIQPPICDNQ